MNTRFPLFRLIIVFACLLSAASLVSAQEAENFAENPAAVKRPNLLQKLNLTNAQIRQIRVLNRERRPQLQAAQQRLRQANQTLDQAVYADVEDEANIQRLMQAVQTAQRDVLRLRIEIERDIRRLLTPAQLERFRSLRSDFQSNRPRNNQINRVLKNRRKPALRRVNQ